MAQSALLTLRESAVRFGNKVIFESLDLTMQSRSKICLIGRNGAGKTTLMRMITGEQELDGGERWLEPGIKIGVLPQDVEVVAGQSVMEYVSEQIPASQRADEGYAYRVDRVIEPLELQPNWMMDTMSGGQVRRAALARALIEEPDILLLDEPTNHLDLPGIEWLEGYLSAYRGTVLCVSHDKKFLENMSDTIYWLDRGQVRVCNKGFAHFESWSQDLLDQEARSLKNRQKQMEQETEWERRGVSGRRKRNIRRLELLREERAKLKADQSAFRRVISKIQLPAIEATESSKIVTEFYAVSHQFTNKEGEVLPILDQFNFRIMRGDRIGILGHNGTGKTSFLRLLTGEMDPEKGKVKRMKGLEFSYFDQRRKDLILKETIQKNLIPGGGDYITAQGKDRHVCGYLKQFLFDPSIVRDPVFTLSGGQKNRLLLAKILANPKPFLILDEPTNDLDMDTLEMLEDMLGAYEGTLILVSHDRDFLDRTVSKILAFEGGGEVELYMGGYSDYVQHKAREATESEQAVNASKGKTNGSHKNGKKIPAKVTYKIQYELDHLPARIKQMEQRRDQMQERLSDPDFYESDPDGFIKMGGDFDTIEKELEQAELRWLELSEMVEG